MLRKTFLPIASITLFLTLNLLACSWNKPLAKYSQKSISENDLREMVNLFFGDYARLQKGQKKKILKDMALIQILSESYEEKSEKNAFKYTRNKVLSDFVLRNWEEQEEKNKETFVPLYHILLAPDAKTLSKKLSKKDKESLSQRYREKAYSLIEKLSSKEISWARALKESSDNESIPKGGSLGYIARNTRFPAQSFPQISLILLKTSHPEKVKDYSFCRAIKKTTLKNNDKIAPMKIVLCRNNSSENKPFIEILYAPDKKSSGISQDFRREKMSGDNIFPPVLTFYGWHIFKNGPSEKMDKEEYLEFMKKNTKDNNAKGIINNVNFVWDKILSERLKIFIEKKYSSLGISPDFSLQCDWRSKKDIIRTKNFIVTNKEFSDFLDWAHQRYAGQFTQSCETQQSLFKKYLRNRIFSDYGKSIELDKKAVFKKRMEWEIRSEISQNYMNDKWLSNVTVGQQEFQKEKKSLQSLYKNNNIDDETIKQRLLLIKKKKIINSKKEALLKEKSFHFIEENL